jgi:hypothetical protein
MVDRPRVAPSVGALAGRRRGLLRDMPGLDAFGRNGVPHGATPRGRPAVRPGCAASNRTGPEELTSGQCIAPTCALTAACQRARIPKTALVFS